ncbi:MAG: Gfo/Idh/MocA family oxidoreductase, partial [Lentisphaeria bacterium]|nr:Gfo/Idh/MocA family oxidoreductase [Lentisphaeria bacterium]
MSEFKGKLRCGVVGLGVGKRRHIEGYRTHPNAEVVAIADLDPARLEDVGNAYGIDKRYPTLTDMLRHEKLDVISIATPNKLHMPQTVEALEAGCHVLCEKPMALTEKDGLKMIEASKRTGKRVMINFSTRISPEAYAIKRAVDAGTLGDIYFARSIWMRR